MSFLTTMFVVILTLTTLLIGCTSHRDKIDIADVEINVKDYPTYIEGSHSYLRVLAQNSDCWKVG